MEELRPKSFDEAVGIMHTQLMFVDQQAIRRRLSFEKCEGTFNSPNTTDKRASQERDNTQMGNEEGDVVFTPGPARQSGNSEIRREQNQPKIKPRRSIDVSPRYFGVEARFIDRAGNAGDDQNR